MKNLILLTNFFPYGTGEPYLETEFEYLHDKFDEIYLCSLQLRKSDFDSKRSLPKGKSKNIAIAKASNTRYFIESFRVLFDVNLYKEIARLCKDNRFSFSRLVSLFVYLSRSHYEAAKIIKWLKKEGLNRWDKGMIYSYRFEYQPYVGLLIKRMFPDFKVIARGHRFDLYEERHLTNYIPMREYLLKSLDKTIMISQDGINYLTNKYPEYTKKLILSRLGTKDYGKGPINHSKKSLNIISCSTLTDIKRVHLIIEALSCLDFEVIWHHYGAGPLKDDLMDMANEKLSSNIKWEFKGHISNEDLMGVYRKTPYDVFINVSSSEGVPVSIMEAQSFGIPIIATDAGGTKEIVFDGINGFLLKNDFQIEELIDLIRQLRRMSSIEIEHLRGRTRENWEKNSSAEKLYNKFISDIL